MKFLIAFAVIAVASATEDLRGVHLPPAPAPEVASVDYLPLVAPAYLFDALNVPTPNEENDANEDTVIVKAEPVIVGEISAAPVEDYQNEHFSVIVVDLPLEASDAVDVHIKQLEPIMVGEIPTAENIEPVKVATPVVDNEAPALDKVRVFNPSMLPRYADPTLR